MKPFGKITAFFIFFMFVWGAGCSSGTLSADKYEDISASKAHELIADKSVLLLDVRTPAEYKQAYIKDAFLIPVQVLSSDYTKINSYKDKPVLIYCRSGNRSVTAAKILLNQGFKKIYNMKGGIKSWVKKGYPVVSGQ